jgi:hypothetical protein
MRAAILALFLAGSLAAQTGSLAGTVVDRASGWPLAGVHVRIYIGLMPDTAKEPHGAMTDAGGRFSMAAITPGTYTVELERAGFLAVPGDGFMGHTEMVIHPGEQIAGSQSEMLPLILIAGREPVRRPRFRHTSEGIGGRRPPAPRQPAVHSVQRRDTDERGQFRLFMTFRSTSSSATRL